MIKTGSRWTGTEGTVFVVLGTTEIEGNKWVYYRKEGSGPPQEFSCFEESFLARFNPILQY